MEFRLFITNSLNLKKKGATRNELRLFSSNVEMSLKHNHFLRHQSESTFH